MFTLGTGPVMLVAARCLQGASAGIVYTVGLALLVDTVGRDQLGAWMGSTLSGMSAGVMISPFIAGMIYAAAGYYAVFIILLAVIGFVFMLPIIMIEKKTAEKWLKVKNAETNYGTFSDEPDEDHKPDVRPGIPTTDQYKSNPKDTEAEEGTEHQCPSPENLEDNESDAGFDKTLNPEKGLTRHLKTMVVLMKSPGIVAAMYGGFVQVALICAFDGILPFFVKKTFDWNSSGAGSIFLAITVPSLAAPLVGTLSDRIGARVIVLAGFAISTLALALLSLVGHNSLSQVILLCALLVMTGIAQYPHSVF